MKYPLFLIALLVLIALSLAYKKSEKLTEVAWTFASLGLFIIPAIPQLDVYLYSWPAYPGVVKGIQISTIDFVFLFLFFQLQEERQALPFQKVMIFYFVCVLASIYVAALPKASLFYLWQLIRMYVVFWIVAQGCKNEKVLPAILNGFSAGLVLEATVSIFQRYGEGVFQARGTFIHQNALGLVSNLCAILILALLLKRRQSWLLATAPMSACVIAVLTASRASILLLALGFITVFVYSSISDPSSRKLKIGVAGMLFLMIVTPIGWASLEKRYDSLGDSSYDERAAYNLAAAMMLDDHPFGIGANNFVLVANTGGYYERAGVVPVDANRTANVHNFYWLTAAETGYVGLLSLLLLLMQPLVTTLRFSWRFRHEPEGALFAGCFVTLLVSYAHSTVEFAMALSQIQYFLMIIFGIIASYSQRLSNFDSRKSRFD